MKPDIQQAENRNADQARLRKDWNSRWWVVAAKFLAGAVLGGLIAGAIAYFLFPVLAEFLR